MSDLIKAIRDFYAENPAGGRLHICLDDGNMEEGNVWWCLENAATARDLWAVKIACCLLDLSEDERFALYERYSDYRYR
jgi:hypothetical protein